MSKPYPNHKKLSIMAMIFSTLFWVGLLGFGHSAAHQSLTQLGLSDFEINRFLPLLVIVILAVLFIVDYLQRMRKVFRFRGYAAEVGSKQFPDLFGRVQSVCGRLKISELPTVYLSAQPGLTGSSSVRFHRRDFLALEAETIAALTERQSAIDYLIGYEIARLHDPSSRWRYFLWPATVVPILGPAFARSRIYSFDSSGIEACKTKVDAAFGLAIQVAGTRRWQSLNIPQLASQSADNRSLWMSVNELISSQPWFTKRMARLRAIATNSDTFIPRRNPVSYIIAVVIPYMQLRSFIALFQLTLILLWIILASFWADIAYRQLQQNGMLEWLGDKQEAPKAAFFTRKWLNETKPATETKTVRRYERLHQDLQQLGKLARTRYKKYGDIPCEAGNIRGIKLNYRASRYAYSCEEPVVYTRVAYGEFEPGRPAHVQSYDWEKNRILKSILLKKSSP